MAVAEDGVHIFKESVDLIHRYFIIFFLLPFLLFSGTSSYIIKCIYFDLC